MNYPDGQRIDEILAVTYEDGSWSKPYFDCGGGNIWMLTYTVPFFGFKNNTYYFKGTSGIDIDLRHVDIDQCPIPENQTQLNIFADSAKCKKNTTMCVSIAGLGFRRGSYKCVCKRGFYFPKTNANQRYFNGTEIEKEYEKKLLNEENQYDIEGMFECLPCPEGCDACTNDRPCVVALNWPMRTSILCLSCIIAGCVPVILFFTWKWQHIKVIRAASPVLLRVILSGASLLYGTMVASYFKPSIYSCVAKFWLREVGFVLTYGALMLKTYRISVIFRVRSAKAVKITDMTLLKRLGIILTFIITLLTIRTIVAPPIVIVGRTEDDLKAYLCLTDWWDTFFSGVELTILIWGIRLCILVRKAPSEFNECKFISLAIYNEFILCLFMNVTSFFLKRSANPDLMYIIYFVQTQLSVTLLLGLIFGSKLIMVIKDKDKPKEEGAIMVYKTPSRFLAQNRPTPTDHSYATTSFMGPELLRSGLHEQDVLEEFQRVCTQLEMLKERNMRKGNRHLVSKISAMQDAARMCDGNNEACNKIAEICNNYSPPPEPQAAAAQVGLQEEEILKIQKICEADEAPVASNEPKETEVEIHQTDPTNEATEGMNVAAVNNEDGTEEEVDGQSDAACAETDETAADDANSADANGKTNASHTKTSSIVINLDEESRFSDEVAV